MRNRSVPPNTVLPHVTYQDVAEAVGWLAATFGFIEHYHYGEPGGPVSGAQMSLGDAWIMLKRAGGEAATPAQLGARTQALTVFVEDVDAHFERTKAAGVAITEQIQETCYGERQYGVEDLAGHRWLFSQHVRDVSPADWGAQIARPWPS